MSEFKLGAHLWNQASSWADLEAAARRIDALGYAHLWIWDHLYAINSRDPYLPIFEGWTALGALARITERTRIGLLVGANTFRNPGLTANAATTLDHISGGRAIVGLGGAWFDFEHRAHGLDFGSGFGERLDWLDEAVAAVRDLLADRPVTSEPEAHYHFDDLRLRPLPVQQHLPIMVGGGGEQKTLKTVARYADMWNVFGDAARLARKDSILRQHCADVGRDADEIERTVSCKIVIRDSTKDARNVWAAQMVNNDCPEQDWDDATELWLGSPEFIADEIRTRRAVGFDTLIAMLAAPYDIETIERLIGEVKPLIDAD